jgi:hypothetical protein
MLGMLGDFYMLSVTAIVMLCLAVLLTILLGLQDINR